tara:strand:+ start:120 stop:1406 length:1287 start_codon:yes stop_codon:yes gene_type:complete
MNILILGMPNVGKTSLFNIITNQDNNIIHKTIGTTRDWHFASYINNKNIFIYDTPGLININKLDKMILNLEKKIDIFLYVVNYKNNNFINDKELINKLRKFNKKIILIVNKDDNLDKDKNFDTFGLKNIFYISCSHKLGIDYLLDYLNKFKISSINELNYDFSIALFGKTNVGKSTLLNNLVGFKRSEVSDQPKTTTDIVSSSYNFKDQNFLIKDTAGLIKKNKIDKNSLDYFATKKTLSILRDIDINIFLIDVQQGFDNQSKKIFNMVYNKSNIFLLVINKIDLIKVNKKKILLEIRKNIEDQFSQSKNIHIVEISSLNIKDILKLKKFINKITFNIITKISTSELNQWLKKTTFDKPHSRIKGKEVKFKYATQISNNPLTIKIFSNFSKEISNQYKRYLINNFYSYFGMKSKNIKIVVSKSLNPYN